MHSQWLHLQHPGKVPKLPKFPAQPLSISTNSCETKELSFSCIYTRSNQRMLLFSAKERAFLFLPQGPTCVFLSLVLMVKH